MNINHTLKGCKALLSLVFKGFPLHVFISPEDKRIFYHPFNQSGSFYCHLQDSYVIRHDFRYFRRHKQPHKAGV